MVITPENSPIPTIATVSAASNRLGMVRTTSRMKRKMAVTTWLRVTTVVARNASGTATAKPITVPRTDILMVRIIGSMSVGM